MKFKLFQSAVSILVVGLLSACGNVVTKDFSQLYIGMPKSEVIQILDKPDGVRATQGVEYLIYNATSPGHYLANPAKAVALDRKLAANTQFVRIINGKVDAYGVWGDFGSTKDPTATINQNIKVESSN